jgi:hypothetical protein
VKLPRLLLLSLTASLAFAQQARQDENSTQWSPVTLAGEFLEHDFVNWFAYANGVYDSYAPAFNGGTTNNGSFGWEIGGGVSASHAFRDGEFSLSYRGDYRDYQNSFYTTGTDQNLGVSYSKRLARRLTLSTSLGAGIAFYGSTFFSSSSSGSATVVPNNPFSSETKYLSTGVSLSYQQSRRLSYVVGGSYFLQRYNYAGAIGAAGTSGSASAFYRTSARTTVGATYSHSYFAFQRGAGNANADTVQASVSHVFPDHWTASVSGGVTHSSVSGLVSLPTGLPAGTILAPGVTVGPGGYIAGRYQQSTSFPSFSGTVGRSYRHSNAYASAGQGISSGNGYYLASKSLYFNGLYSIAIRQRQNVSFSGGYSRLSSVANTVSAIYSSSSLTAAYGISLMRYFGVNAHYDYIHFGSLSPNTGINDNRLAFGINFSSKSIPLTLF